MFCAYMRPRYQVSVYRIIGPLVFNAINTSGYIVAWAIYTSHTDKFAPKHTIFYCTSVCLSVIFSYFLVQFCLHPRSMLGKF